MRPNFWEQSSSKIVILNWLQNYSVTNSGELISLTGAYEASVDLGDFCLGVAIGDDNVVSRVAVVCDPCDGAVCINSCCPPSKVTISPTFYQ
jgi:hypothetical protein